MLDMVRNDSELILVMGRFGIPLGFGDKTVGEVCRLHDVDENTFLSVANYITVRDYRCEDVSLASLIRYLKQSHDYYLDFNLPNIRCKLIESIDCSEPNDISMLVLGCPVKTAVNSGFGGVGDKRTHKEDSSKPVIFITGNCSFGGIVLR